MSLTLASLIIPFVSAQPASPDATTCAEPADAVITFHIGPLTPTLMTCKSGSLQDMTFTGSLKTGITGKVVANDFAVPIIQPSKTCPWLIAKLVNVLAGLPAAPGKASISMNGSITSP